MTSFAIIVAGGKGLRMGADLPKQFLPIGGRPVLMHTLEAFERAIPGIHLILVLPADHQPFWRDLCRQHSFTLPHAIATGGPTRFHSVLNGLKTITPEPGMLVAVHDGVRPFVSADVIRRTFEAARDHGAAVPVIPVVETLRQLSTSAPSPFSPSLSTQPSSSFPSAPPSSSSSTSATVPAPLGAGSSRTVDRSLFRLVQTPQTFQFPLLLKAYGQPYRETFTDDASVVEALGHPITLVEGNRENIKITTPFDLTIAEALLRGMG